MAKHYHTNPDDKPYRFVPLADHVERQEVVGHHGMEEEKWYGHLDPRREPPATPGAI